MEWLLFVIAALFMLAGAVCLLLVVLQLPGTWIMIGLALIIELLDGLYLPDERAVTFGWMWLLIAIGLALLGELIEFVAGAAGAKYGGGTRRSVIGAIIGGIGGAILLTPLLPVPVVGTLVGAIIGTFLGALLGEMSGVDARTARESFRPAVGAAFGRVVGTTGKFAIAVVVYLILVVAAFWPPQASETPPVIPSPDVPAATEDPSAR